MWVSEHAKRTAIIKSYFSCCRIKKKTLKMILSTKHEDLSKFDNIHLLLGKVLRKIS